MRFPNGNYNNDADEKAVLELCERCILHSDLMLETINSGVVSPPFTGDFDPEKLTVLGGMARKIRHAIEQDEVLDPVWFLIIMRENSKGVAANDL